MEMTGGQLDTFGFCEQMRNLVAMVERGEVWISGFTVSLEGSGDMEFKVQIGGIGPQTRIERLMDGTMLPITTRSAAPGASEFLTGLAQSARRDPLRGATSANTLPRINPWSKDGWNLTEQGKVIRTYGSKYAETLAREAGSRIGATAQGQTEVANGGFVVSDPRVIDRIRNEIAAAKEIARLKEQELAEAEKLRKPRVPEGTRDLDLDI